MTWAGSLGQRGNALAVDHEDPVAGEEGDRSAALDGGDRVGGGSPTDAGDGDAGGIGVGGGPAGHGEGSSEVEFAARGQRELAGAGDRADHRDEVLGVFIDGEGQLGIDQVVLGVEVADGGVGLGASGGRREP